jgi:hypothetical protein
MSKKNMRIKRLIRKKFKENYHGDGEIEITNRSLKDGYWNCTWFGSFDIPDWFDATVREGIEEEIKPYCEQKYKEVVDCFRQCFGEVQDRKRDSRYYNDDKWYTLSCPFPPSWICIPDIYENIYDDENNCKECETHRCWLCENKKEILVQPARLKTKEEIEEMIEKIKEGKNPYIDEYIKKIQDEIIREIEWEKENALKYFNFVGGSPFTDECWELKRYAGINMWGEFSFSAIGEFAPHE